jgi:hypothetical protein
MTITVSEFKNARIPDTCGNVQGSQVTAMSLYLKNVVIGEELRKIFDSPSHPLHTYQDR